MTGGQPTRRDALREVARLAIDDRRRGVRAWFDPVLADGLRQLVREIDAEETGKPARSSAAARSGVPGRSGDAGGSGMAGRAGGSAKTGDPTRTGTAGRSADARPVDGPEAGGATAKPAAGAAWGPPPPATGRTPDWAERLQALGAEAAACRACGLCATRTTVVFGGGQARVPLVFVGEAPGRDEDLQGIPFVGRAGQLLTRIIEAIGLSRDEVYICNVLKCRPPENRNPEPDEIAACRHFLQSQLEILQPKVICTLGLFASQLLLESTAPIGKLRGRLFEQGGWRILPTYHPAALLRNPSLKSIVWEDVQLLRRTLDS